MSNDCYVTVVLDEGLTRPLDYKVPSELASRIEVGTRVLVPLRKKTQKGTISAIKPSSLVENTRSILEVLSWQRELSEPMFRLANWMASYYLTPLQRVFRCFIPPNIRKDIRPKETLVLELNRPSEEILSLCASLRAKKPSQAEVLDLFLKEKKGLFLSDLKKYRSAISSLLKQGVLLARKERVDENFNLEEEFFPTLAKPLYAEQEKCLKSIQHSLEKGVYETHLIFGVTGSGKTEVYLQAIQKALEQNKSALFLVPEISLTSQTIERIRARFSEKVAVLHHRRSLQERASSWEGLKTGNVRIAIGARSALFAPMKNLGLLIVDEEHDSSYKQSDEAPCYQARDVAVMRGFLEKAVVLLGSATPSIESFYNANVGKYTLHSLSTRASGAFATTQIIDMKRAYEKTGRFTHFSPELLEKIEARWKVGEQSLLFLNARGYHRKQLCQECGHIILCSHCDVALLFSKSRDILECPLCSAKQKAYKACPNCHSLGSLLFKGFGTEAIERSLKAIFPNVRTLRMDRDTTTKKHSHEEMFRSFRAHKADVLIGTQMIAKGFHFPLVTLVCVLSIDQTLSIPDFRSEEMTFQLLTQVAGRSGRSDLKGEVLFQTTLPSHPVIQYAKNQDYLSFYQSQLEERKRFKYPPFTHLIKALFSGKDKLLTEEEAKKTFAFLQRALPSDVTLLPVIAAGHSKVKDLYRFQFLIKTPSPKKLSPLLSQLPPSKVQRKWDVDPISTFF